MSRWHFAAGAAAGAALAAGVVEVARQRDARRLAGDPERHILTDPPKTASAVVRSPDGTELHVEHAGPPSETVVVLVHGWGMSSRFWHYQLRDLPPDVRTIAFDLRGHARSTTSPVDRYDLGALATDLDAVLDAYAEGARAVLVGHSLGGMTILEWVRRNRDIVRDRLAGVLLMNTSHRAVTTRVFPRLAAAEKFGRLVMSNRLPAPASSPVSRRAVRRISLSEEARPAHVALTEQLFFDCPASVRAALGVTLCDVHLDEALPHLRVPTVVATGTRDRLVPPRYTRDLANAIPAAELVEFEGAGHQTALERHREITALIRRLVAGETASSRDYSSGATSSR